MFSVVIPARNEKWLNRTLDDIYYKFRGDFEVIVVLDGGTAYPLNHSHVNLIVLENKEPEGIRKALNRAVNRSSGNYILKLDAHCAFDKGFDEKLRKYIDKDKVMVARRYTLDYDTWGKLPRIVDYYYLSCPWTHPRKMMMQSCPWISRTETHMDITPIDDLMCFQGSMWMMSRQHWDWLGGLDEELTYAEHHEISMKTWLGGKKVVINKDTWYAHPAKIERGYHMSMSTVYYDHDLSARYWMENRWSGPEKSFEWLIDKFWPLPTEHNRHRLEKYYWTEDWRERYYDIAL